MDKTCYINPHQNNQPGEVHSLGKKRETELEDKKVGLSKLNGQKGFRREGSDG